MSVMYLINEMNNTFFYFVVYKICRYVNKSVGILHRVKSVDASLVQTRLLIKVLKGLQLFGTTENTGIVNQIRGEQ